MHFIPDFLLDLEGTIVNNCWSKVTRHYPPVTSLCYK
uniref:Uncharacterized protein n=1 Tax=Arundo donax TaxID=35708 RepID=A0A0A9BCQ0_ARUDO